MESPSSLLGELRRHASSFIKEKINSARLKLTNATQAQLLTEEVTDGNSWPPDPRTMALISRSAFDVDDSWRIVEVLHKRLRESDRRNWRTSYKALILLEHGVTRGPKSVADEFDCDVDVITEMRSFQYVDEKGFDWGSRARKLAERVLKLLDQDQGHYLEQERVRARGLARGIQGYGSFNLRPSNRAEANAGARNSSTNMFSRCNSEYNNSNHNIELGDGRCAGDDHPFNKTGHDKIAAHLMAEPDEFSHSCICNISSWGTKNGK